jgi:hypothetical protein
MAQRPGPERFQELVELAADPGNFGLGDAGFETQRSNEIIDLAGRHAVHVSLHHHREQGPVDAPAPLEHRQEEAAAAQLRDLELHVAGLGRQQPATAAVALVRARLRALIRRGTDHLGRLRLDQRLEHHLDALADHVDVAASADHLQQLGKVIMGEGHRVVSFA